MDQLAVQAEVQAAVQAQEAVDQLVVQAEVQAAAQAQEVVARFQGLALPAAVLAAQVQDQAALAQDRAQEQVLAALVQAQVALPRLEAQAQDALEEEGHGN